jgi:hypothetical protein
MLFDLALRPVRARIIGAERASDALHKVGLMPPTYVKAYLKRRKQKMTLRTVAIREVSNLNSSSLDVTL